MPTPTPTSAPARKKKGKKRTASSGRAYIQATYNNTLVTITDDGGNVLGWSSAGHIGFKGPKKSTPYAATLTVKDVLGKIAEVGLKKIDIFVKGVGSGREAAVRALATSGLSVTAIRDRTPIPHNGCRPPKVRRV